MYKTILSILFISLSISFLNAQNVSEEYQDGVIYFKIDYSKGVTFKVNDDLSVDLTEFPELEKTFKKFGVTSLTRPFYLFNNKNLLYTLRAEFTRMYEVDALVQELNKNDIIEFAEKVPLEKISWIPNDPYYSVINGKNYKWYLEMIKADSAWNVQTGSPHIKVAIVDNFIWGNHPDLQISSSNLCKFTSSTQYTVGSASPSSSSIPQNNSSTAYSASHGTHCAGLVGAINDNNIGIASIGGGVTLMGVSAGKESNPRYIQYGAEAVQWAANNGANVISMSYGSSSSSTTVQTLLQTCYDAGIVLVAAAGNEGDEDNYISYPAGYPSVISVASANGDGKLSYFSQWGPGRADIAAPGGFIASETTYPNILSTTYCYSYLFGHMYSSVFSNTNYDGMQGTSMACPIVAGLCGLMLSKDSTLSPNHIKTRLQETATPLNSASTHTIDGHGIINAYAALGYNYLVVSDTGILFSSQAQQSRSIYIYSSVDWSIDSVPVWLSITPTSGNAGETVVNISTNSLNNGNDIFFFPLTIRSMEVNPKYINITQVNYELMVEISPKNITLPGAKGSQDTLFINTNLDWEIINESNWLGVDKTSGNGPDTIIIHTKSANTWNINREMYLIVKGASFKNDTAVIIQRLPDFLNLDVITKNMGPTAGSTASVFVLSNMDWTISGSSDWVSASVDHGKDTIEVTFTALSDNTSGSNRNAVFTIANASFSRHLTIVQQSDLSVNDGDYTHKIKVYPNPANDYIIIQTINLPLKKIQVYDLIGKEIASYEGSNEIRINTSSLSKGVYIVKCQTESNNIVYKKFIKQ